MLPSLPGTHAFLGHFPVALFLFGLGCDAALLARFRYAWLDRAALLSFAGAALSSLLTAVSGKISFDSLASSLAESEVAAVGLHGDWAFATVVFFFIVLALRFDAFWRDRALAAPRATGARVAALLLSIVAAYSLVETASRGGELVLRYGVGVERGR